MELSLQLLFAIAAKYIMEESIINSVMSMIAGRVIDQGLLLIGSSLLCFTLYWIQKKGLWVEISPKLQTVFTLEGNRAILLQCLSACPFIPSLISTLQILIALTRIDSEYFTARHGSVVLDSLACLLTKSDSLLQSHVIELAKLLASNRKKKNSDELTIAHFKQEESWLRLFEALRPSLIENNQQEVKRAITLLVALTNNGSFMEFHLSCSIKQASDSYVRCSGMCYQHQQ